MLENPYQFDEFLECLPREALEQIQLCKFQLMLRVILESNKFYQTKLGGVGITSAEDIGTFDQFRRLPFTTKTELSTDQTQNPPYGTNLTFPRRQYVHIHQTSGTTGEPLRCLDTSESWEWWARCWTTVYRSAGVTAEDRIFFAFSFGPFIGFWSAFEGAQRVGALALPGGGMSSSQRLKSILSNDATVLVCTPTYALHLAEIAVQEGFDLRASSVRTTIHAGEPGASLPATRKRIQDAWGARAYDHAGATEIGAWGFEAQEQDGLYINEGEFIAEVIDPVTGEATTDGELVLTNLGRVGMPVIRYRTGDRVSIASEPSISGRTLIRLQGGVIGRVDDVLIIRGINVFPSAIENMVRSFPEIGEFAVDVHRKDNLDEMALRVEITGGERESIAADLTNFIRNALGLRVHVEQAPYGTLPRFDLKSQRFNDHRKD